MAHLSLASVKSAKEGMQKDSIAALLVLCQHLMLLQLNTMFWKLLTEISELFSDLKPHLYYAVFVPVKTDKILLGQA